MIGVRGQNKKHLETFANEIVPLVLTGPPTVTGFGGGRPRVREVIAYWPALLKKEEVEPKVLTISVI